MGFATHLGPWLLGTVKYTTGTGSGNVRNTGATVVTQQAALVGGTQASIMLPAGAIIHRVQAYMTTGAVGTPNVVVGSTTIGTLSTAQGLNDLTVTAANVGTMANVGLVDVALTYTPTAATVGVLSVEYTVRNYDGAANPTPYQN